jgi:hypothetical protein
MGQAVDERLLEATRALAGELHYSGVGMCEFRIDPATGDCLFLELNPRFWGSLPLALSSGADFPWFLYQMLVEGVREFPQAFETGKRCRDLRADLRWMSRAWRSRPGLTALYANQAEGWGINERSNIQLMGDLMRMALLRDGIDSFAWDDPGPFLSELWNMLMRHASPPRVRKKVRERAIRTVSSITRFARSE